MKKTLNNILISRTDSIGDVVLSSPVAAVLKQKFPNIKIGFLGKNYTKDIINTCANVDEFVSLDDFLNKPVTICGQKPEAILHVLPVSAIALRAKKLNIPLRIGTTNRLYHWTTCNRLVKLGRKNSNLHEAQLNLKLLQPLGIHKDFSLEEIWNNYDLTRIKPLAKEVINLIDRKKYNLILHPKSRGSAREWGINNFINLIKSLDQNIYKIFISGTEKEREDLQPIFNEAGELITDISGLLDLSQFISFIHHCDGVVACSTGPLHISAALRKDALGIYPPIRPIHPERWGPVGPRAQIFVLDKICNACDRNRIPCNCIMNITPFQIKNALDKITSGINSLPE